MTEDEQEALSRKYADSTRVMRLSSGNYAVFHHHTLVGIGSWTEAQPMLNSYVPEAARPARARLPAQPKKTSATANLSLEDLGL